MRLLVIDPGVRLWGSERALLATLPGLVEAYDSVIVLTPPAAELAEEAAKLGFDVDTAPIGNLHRKGRVSRTLAFASIVATCRRHRVEAIYLNQAGLCRLIHVVARLLRLPLVIHVRLVEDIPRCARLSQQPTAPVTLVFVSKDMLQRYSSVAPLGDRKQLVMAYDVVEMASREGRRDHDPPPSISCLGRLEAGKGQRELVEALGLLAAEGRSIRAELIGAADEEDAYVRALKTRITELHLDSAVTIRGYLPGASALLAEHRFAVICSKYESFGRVVAEAWASGSLPIVSSESGGAAELVRASGGGLLFEGHSPEQIAGTLAEAALLSETDRGALICAGRKWARAHLSMEEYRRALRGVLFHRASTSPSPQPALTGAMP